jgi:hypothetical protein
MPAARSTKRTKKTGLIPSWPIQTSGQDCACTGGGARCEEPPPAIQQARPATPAPDTHHLESKNKLAPGGNQNEILPRERCSLFGRRRSKLGCLRAK